MSRWLVIRGREAKLLVKRHFELDPDALIRPAHHAVPRDFILAGLQQLFEIRVITNRAGYHDWLIATNQLHPHLPGSPTHHVVKAVCVSFARGLHSPCCVLHEHNSVMTYGRPHDTSAHEPLPFHRASLSCGTPHMARYFGDRELVNDSLSPALVVHDRVVKRAVHGLP